MSIKNKKGFTLIELVAVLVIMAIIALIVTPLVMSIIKKARISADKRSIDAYGRSIEIAIANYLLDNGDFPTDISQLNIEYSGDEVVCSTTQINPDSSVYLAGCTVGGRSVDYSYGTDKTPSAPTYTAYSVGDEVSYNNVDYYVIKDSGAKEQAVTLLKAEPLTVSEVNFYGGVGTENNHINRYSSPHGGSACNKNGYGTMAYYSNRETCNTDSEVLSGCTNEYELSDIKSVVDEWSLDNVPLGLLGARLITYDELMLEKREVDRPWGIVELDFVKYDWMYDNNYVYWTMSAYQGTSTDYLWVVTTDGGIDSMAVADGYSCTYAVVRPVIVLDKSAITTN